MSNIFIKRVAKLLDGLPTHGYSESCKPIRAPVNTANTAARKNPRKQVQSEFELHTQVLQNTWGRIEFEIEPLNQSTPLNQPSTKAGEYSVQKVEPDYKVRVKTRHRIPSPVPAQPAHLKAISSQEIRTLVKEQQKQIAPQMHTKKVPHFADNQVGEVKVNPPPAQEKMDETPPEIIDQKKVEQKTELVEKFQTAKRALRKEFACRESQRMLTLISERKAQATLLQERSVFANFALPVLETLAKSPQTPKSSLKWLAFHENPAIRKAVAKNRNSDLEILALLARDENESIRETVAENPLVDKEFLLKLLNDDQGTVVKKAQEMLLELNRNQALENNRATLSALNDYVDAGEPGGQYVPNEADFMQVIAAKDTTPAQRLAQLSTHADWNVRLAVANNPHTTARTLCLLAKDPVPLVRKRVMFNPNCPPEIVLQGQGHRRTGTQTPQKVK